MDLRFCERVEYFRVQATVLCLLLQVLFVKLASDQSGNILITEVPNEILVLTFSCLKFCSTESGGLNEQHRRVRLDKAVNSLSH